MIILFYLMKVRNYFSKRFVMKTMKLEITYIRFQYCIMLVHNIRNINIIIILKLLSRLSKHVFIISNNI